MERAFTLIEVLVVVGVIAALTAILLTCLNSTRKGAEQGVCLSNIHQVANSIHMYMSDNDWTAPDINEWRDWAEDHPNLPHCPMAEFPEGEKIIKVGLPGYALNTRLVMPVNAQKVTASEDMILFPTTTVMLSEQAVGIYVTLGPNPCKIQVGCGGGNGEPGFLRHHGGANYAFCDGHTKWYRPEQVGDIQVANDGSHPTFSLR